MLPLHGCPRMSAGTCFVYVWSGEKDTLHGRRFFFFFLNPEREGTAIDEAVEQTTSRHLSLWLSLVSDGSIAQPSWMDLLSFPWLCE